MAYRVRLAPDVKQDVDRFPAEFRRAWDLRLNELINDPLPHEGTDFSIVQATNEYGDRFLSFVVDVFPFVVQYDVYDWPETEENLLGYDGEIKIWCLAPAETP